MSEPPPAVEARPEVPPWRLLLTLGLAGALSGLLLMLVHEATAGPIARYKEKVLLEAVTEVLGGPERTVTLYRVDGALSETRPEGVEDKDLERVFLGLDAADAPLGFALVSAEPGFQDLVRVIYGYDARDKKLLGMLVLEHRETPGLGDKIVKDEAFVGQFSGRAVPMKGVKPGKSTGAETEVDMITGATISSRAVVRIINNSIEKWTPLLEGYLAAEGSR